MLIRGEKKKGLQMKKKKKKLIETNMKYLNERKAARAKFQA